MYNRRCQSINHTPRYLDCSWFSKIHDKTSKIKSRVSNFLSSNVAETPWVEALELLGSIYKITKMTTPELPVPQFLSAEKTEEILKFFQIKSASFTQVGEKKWFFPRSYADTCEKYYNFKARPEDTWIVTYPRSGTTWTQELIWLVSNNFDFNAAKTTHLMARFPYLEMDMMGGIILDERANKKEDTDEEKNHKNIFKPYDWLNEAPSPRFIKSHLPLSLLPEVLGAGSKIVYVARNPKDVAVSYYNFHRDFMLGYNGDFPKFWDFFENDLTVYSPYWEHLKEAWKLRDHPNLLFIFYEDMYKDLSGVIRKVAKFLGKTATDDQVSSLVDHLNIKNLKDNQSVNVPKLENSEASKKSENFIRKGKAGGWKDTFTPELEDRADKWIAENLRDTDLVFPIPLLKTDTI